MPKEPKKNYRKSPKLIGNIYKERIFWAVKLVLFRINYWQFPWNYCGDLNNELVSYSGLENGIIKLSWSEY